MSIHRISSDYLVLRRRDQEEHHKSLVFSQKHNQLLQEKANWENKSNTHLQTNLIQKKTQKEKDILHSNLQRRQSALQALYAQEKKKYEEEIASLQETPEQRMKKMAERAYALKQIREKERENLVHEKKYLLWRNNMDELRNEDIQLSELQALTIRDRQLHEKRLQKLQEEKEEAYYASLVQEGYEKCVKKEGEELGRREQEKKATLEVMREQVELREERKRQEKEEREEKEKERRKAMVEDAARDLVERKEEEERIRLLRHKLDREIVEQREEKEREMREEKEKDRQWIGAILASEKALDEEENRQREIKKRNDEDYKRAMAADEVKREEDYGEEERKLREEQERAQAKEDAGRRRKEEEYWRLMKDVYEVRGEQMREKEEERNRIGDILEREREQMKLEVERLLRLDEEKLEIEKRGRLRNQEELFRQMDYQQVLQSREGQLQSLEKRRMDLEEQKLQEALLEEKRKQQVVRGEIQRIRDANLREFDQQLTGVHTDRPAGRRSAYPVAPMKKLLAPWEK